MASMFVRHKVNDYDNWKRVYDEGESLRKAGGVTAASVHRDATDPNMVIVWHQFKDMNAAQAFASNEDLKAVMQRAGVSGPPEFWFGEDIEHTRY